MSFQGQVPIIPFILILHEFQGKYEKRKLPPFTEYKTIEIYRVFLQSEVLFLFLSLPFLPYYCSSLSLPPSKAFGVTLLLSDLIFFW